MVYLTIKVLRGVLSAVITLNLCSSEPMERESFELVEGLMQDDGCGHPPAVHHLWFRDARAGTRTQVGLSARFNI